ncbi:transposase [Hyella patelloides LEGE 07179]|uniref:Transposase n=1 Tax=Hyella patelloides LEGE 07179 TaxID=945734 RepID=A0A563VMM7_9CYAN|nr:RNA-guided endonuclease TnpB family protein [Hyella patelloides]VEP12671.1 transposase [Hyella patelloides LEGE 07179]
MPQYIVRKLKIGKTSQLDELARAAGELYSRTLVSFWRTVRKKDVWLSGYTMERWHMSPLLHAHTSDAITQSFYASLKSWRSRRKLDPNSKPPRRRRWFYKVTWKSSAITLKDGKLRLSNGKGNQPLIVQWQWERPKQIEMGWNRNAQCYELRACYSQPKISAEKSQKIAAVDLGEIHPMVITDGVDTDIYNGRLLRSKKQYQNKLKAQLSKLIDKKKRGSKRRKKLIKSKQKQLAKIKNQIKDIEHKLTSKAVSTLKKRSVQTLVIGDVRDIRKNIDYGKKANQKLHQWSFGSIRQKLEYKCAKAGIKTELISEAYTSQECLSCRQKNKSKNREYRCSCGFRWHRDGVGCSNIRAKYLGEIPVVGLMARPSGVRWNPHLQCNSTTFLVEESPAFTHGE